MQIGFQYIRSYELYYNNTFISLYYVLHGFLKKTGIRALVHEQINIAFTIAGLWNKGTGAPRRFNNTELCKGGLFGRRRAVVWESRNTSKIN